MKDTNRYIALALCLSLTLGAFVYRPPEAQAIAGVDDAVVIGALLTAFSAGCGLIFANNGMTSNEIAQGMTQKWNEFKETLSTVPSSFASWLGYDSTEELLASCVIVGPSKMNITRPIARKFAEFTDWLTKDLGVTTGSKPVTIAGSNIKDTVLAGAYSYYKNHDWLAAYEHDIRHKIVVACYSPLGINNSSGDVYALILSDIDPVGPVFYTFTEDVLFEGYQCSPGLYLDNRRGGFVASTFNSDFTSRGGIGFSRTFFKLCDISPGLKTSEASTDLSVHAPTGVQTPSLDIPAEGTEEAPITISGVGADATTIEDLLRQILAQVQANTLAPTIEGVDTETGGGTDTEEDAKPYLPYIPRIFGKIKDLPDTLSNIWETIKGLPAAIAEKIGAFFTTLWGWLQSIIDAITALPTAIAEKIAALFTPDEALVTEITDTFKGKFGFLPTLKQFGNDLFGMTAETEPPVIWVHFENAESNYGYSYGDKQKILDLSWYQKYKANVDTLISGFLWLGFLWLLFKRAAAIIQGGEMLAEYGHDLSQGRRDSNETKFQRYLWKD